MYNNFISQVIVHVFKKDLILLEEVFSPTRGVFKSSQTASQSGLVHLAQLVWSGMYA